MAEKPALQSQLDCFILNKFMQPHRDETKEEKLMYICALGKRTSKCLRLMVITL